MKFRDLKDYEKKLIEKEILRYTPKNFFETFNFDRLVILKNKWLTVCYLSYDAKKKLKFFDEIYTVGNVFGEIKNNKFKLSLEGFTIISNYINKNYAIINEKGETLFLYGRDIFNNSIVYINGSGRIAVFNKNRDFLGIGYFDGKMIKNIKDKGWYLRKGG